MKLPKSTTRFKSPKSCFSIRDCNALGTKSPRIRDSSQPRQSLGKWPPWSIFFCGPVSRKIRCFRPTLLRIPNINAYFLRAKVIIPSGNQTWQWKIQHLWVFPMLPHCMKTSNLLQGFTITRPRP